MQCPNCHNEIPNNAKFCKYCGLQQTVPAPTSSPTPSPFLNNNFARTPSPSSFEVLPTETQPTLTRSAIYTFLSIPIILELQAASWILILIGMFQEQYGLMGNLGEFYHSINGDMIFYLLLIIILILIGLDLLLITKFTQSKRILLIYGVLSLLASSFLCVLLFHYLYLFKNPFSSSLTFWGWLIPCLGVLNFISSEGLLTRAGFHSHD